MVAWGDSEERSHGRTVWPLYSGSKLVGWVSRFEGWGWVEDGFYVSYSPHRHSSLASAQRVLEKSVEGLK